MALDLMTVSGPALAITFSYVVFGLTGFGSSVTAMPILVQFMPLRTAVPLMLICDLCAALLLGMKNREAVDRKELLRLVPFMLLGMLLGVTLLMKAPERPLLLLLGAFVLAYSAWSLWFRPAFRRIPAAWSAPLGTIGGVFTALFGTGGPIYTIYLARRLEDKAALRATISTLIFCSGLARLVLFVGAGLYAQHDVLPLAALLLPCALAGLYIGSRLHNRLPVQRVAQVTWGLLILGGLGLIARNL
jgi:uncharacterized membrane protein YfcA